MGKNKDELSAELIISYQEGTASFIAYHIKTDYSNEKAKFLEEEVPTTINGTGQDTKSDWRDVWMVDIKEFTPTTNSRILDNSQTLFLVGSILF